jgi:hypothetical protein
MAMGNELATGSTIKETIYWSVNSAAMKDAVEGGIMATVGN